MTNVNNQNGNRRMTFHSLSELIISRKAAEFLRKYFSINTDFKSDVYMTEENENGIRICFRDESDNQTFLSPAQLLIPAFSDTGADDESLIYRNGTGVFMFGSSAEREGLSEHIYKASPDDAEAFLNELFYETDFIYECIIRYDTFHETGKCRLISIIPDIPDFHFCTEEKLIISGTKIKELAILEDNKSVLNYTDGKLSADESYSNLWNDEKWNQVITLAEVKQILSVKSDFLKNITLPASCILTDDDALSKISRLNSVTVLRSNTKFGVHKSAGILSVKGIKGSTAQKFAEENGYNFTALSEDEYDLSAEETISQDEIVSEELPVFDESLIINAVTDDVITEDINSENIIIPEVQASDTNDDEAVTLQEDGTYNAPAESSEDSEETQNTEIVSGMSETENEPEAAEHTELTEENIHVSDEITREFLRGERIDVTDCSEITVRLTSDNGFAEAETDMYIFMLRENGKAAQDEDLVYFGNKISQDNSVSDQSDDTEHYIVFCPSKLSEEIHRVVVCISAYGDDQSADLSGLINPALEVRSSDSAVSGKYRIETDTEKSVEVLEFYRHSGKIKMKINGSGYNTGMESLCERYGIDIK